MRKASTFFYIEFSTYKHQPPINLLTIRLFSDWRIQNTNSKFVKNARLKWTTWHQTKKNAYFNHSKIVKNREQNKIIIVNELIFRRVKNVDQIVNIYVLKLWKPISKYWLMNEKTCAVKKQQITKNVLKKRFANNISNKQI